MWRCCLKITIEHYENKYSAEISEESCLPDVLMTLKNMLKLVGYSFSGELVIDEPEPQD